MAPLYFGLAAVAAATLLYELVLTRLFAIAHGYHFAFLAVSLALLGFGASSNVLALRRKRSASGSRVLPRLAAAGAAGLVASYVAANAIPFDPYRVAWEPRQTMFLAAYLVALAAPFFLLGLVQGLPLTVWPERAGRLYAAALAGSGLGCVGALVSLEWMSGPRAIVLAALVAACGSVAFAVAERSRVAAVPLPAAAVLALAVLLWQMPSWLELSLSPYKPLSQLLEYPGTRVLHRDSNALSRVDVVESPGIRSAPGLSLTYTRRLPRQSALVLDGDTLLPLTEGSRQFFDALPASLPYRLRPRGRVLVVTPGGGMDVRAALGGGALSVVAVEGNPLVADLVASRFAARAGGVYGDRRVRLARSAPRAYLARSDERFDIVDVALAGNYRPVTAGAFSLSETYALTEEAFAAYVDHLAPGGLLVVQRWLQLPPTEELRAAAVLVAALEDAGAEPRRNLVAIRSFSTMLLVAATSPFSERELAEIRSFARERRFDVVYYPGIRADETNRFNVLRSDPYFASFQALLADPGRFLERYAYDVRPPTDDRPFFFHFFKLGQTRTVLSLLGKTWQPFGGSGYLILVGLLGVVILLAILLLVIPLAVPLRRLARASESGAWAWTTAYFGGLGLGFLLVEVALVQRAIVFLDHAAYALGVVLFGLLTWSGIGSVLSARVPWRAALAAAALAAAVYPIVLARVFDLFLGESLGVRIAVMLVLLAPLGLLLGVPFPRGLALVGRTGPDWLPLAWGVNGFASVVGAVLAALIALSFGLAAVFRTGAVAYAIALVALLTGGPGRAERRGRR